MTHQLAQDLATILTDYCSPVQPGEYITIVANPTTSKPIIAALMEAILRRGARPNLQTPLFSPDYSDYFEMYVTLGSQELLETTDPTMLSWVETSHAVFFVKAPLNTKALSTVDPDRIVQYRKGNKPFSERYLQRYDAGELRWTVVGWPTAAQAQAAEMSLRDYTRFVAGACGLDQPDPVAYWQGMREMQERIVAWLADKGHAVVQGPGIDMSFNFAGRPWISCHGEQNFPDGEIFTSPVEDSVNGTVEFNFPCIYQGNEVEGVRLVFQDGRCVEATATKGEEFLVKTLDTDPGARVLGEFAIGTNMGVQQLTRSILFDEKIGGSIHMALGRSYEESKGVNDSAIHWDMIHSMQDGGTITVDGTPFYDSGRFLV